MATATFAAKMLCHGSDTAWNTSGTARQGIYAASDSSMKTPRTGIIYYEGMGNTLKDKFITSISIAYTLGSSGGSWAKTLRLVESNYQTQPTKSGTPYPGSYITNRNALGEYFLSNGGAHSSTITLNDSTNSTLFNNLATYLETGANIICLHSTDTGNKSGYSYSTNYLELSKFTLTVTYEDRYPFYINSEGSTQYLGVSIKYPPTATRPEPANVSAVPEDYFEYLLPSGTEVYISKDNQRPGYTLDSITLRGAGSISEGQGEATVITGAGEASVDVYWDLNTYTINYNLNGKTVTNASSFSIQTKSYGADINLRTTVPNIEPYTEEGDGLVVKLKELNQTLYGDSTMYHEFLGWNTKADGTGTHYRPGAKYTTNAELTLYLQTRVIIACEPVNLPTPKRAGYKFLGWTTRRSDAGVIDVYATDHARPNIYQGFLNRDEEIRAIGCDMLDHGVVGYTNNDPPHAEDIFCYFNYQICPSNNHFVPTIFKTNTDEYNYSDADLEDPFYYAGKVIVNGIQCDKWLKYQNKETPVYYVYTREIVNLLPELINGSVTAVDEIELFPVWKSNGITYIDTGSEMVPHTIWIDTGSEWKQYIAYIDAGSEWHMCGAAE